MRNFRILCVSDILAVDTHIKQLFTTVEGVKANVSSTAQIKNYIKLNHIQKLELHNARFVCKIPTFSLCSSSWSSTQPLYRTEMRQVCTTTFSDVLVLGITWATKHKAHLERFYSSLQTQYSDKSLVIWPVLLRELGQMITKPIFLPLICMDCTYLHYVQ